MTVPKTTMFIMVLLLVFGDILGAQEPDTSQECSRFVYEYKLMELLLKLELENASIKSKLTTIEEKLNSKLEKPVVAARVGLFRTTSGVNKGDVIKYERVMTNIGDGYDTSQGIFVVPVSGTYVFTVTVCLLGDEWMRTKLLLNDAQIGFFMTGDSNWEACNDNVVTTQAVKGDRVWVEKESGSASTLSEEDGWNAFSANLL